MDQPKAKTVSATPLTDRLNHKMRKLEARRALNPHLRRGHSPEELGPMPAMLKSSWIGRALPWVAASLSFYLVVACLFIGGLVPALVMGILGYWLVAILCRARDTFFVESSDGWYSRGVKYNPEWMDYVQRKNDLLDKMADDPSYQQLLQRLQAEDSP